MAKPQYTRIILAQIADGSRVAVRSIGSPEPVRYSPRHLRDSMPWTVYGLRYSGLEVHTVPVCGRRLLSLRGHFTSCAKPTGHDRACVTA